MYYHSDKITPNPYPVIQGCLDLILRQVNRFETGEFQRATLPIQPPHPVTYQ